MKTKWFENRLWCSSKSEKFHRKDGPVLEWNDGRKFWYDRGRLLFVQTGWNHQGPGMKWPKKGPCAEIPIASRTEKNHEEAKPIVCNEERVIQVMART